jgi:hypothetical protein
MFVHEFAHTAPSTRESSGFAQSLVRRALLAEFAATLLHKMSPAAPPEGVAAPLDALGPIGVVVPGVLNQFGGGWLEAAVRDSERRIVLALRVNAGRPVPIVADHIAAILAPDGFALEVH